MTTRISAQSVADANVQARQLRKKPGKRRTLTGAVGALITVLAVALALFQLYTAFFGVLPTMRQRSFHVAFILPMIFLLYPAAKRSPRDRATALDWIFAIASGACALYVFVAYESIATRAGEVYGYELWLGGVFTALVFIAGRRVLGWPLPIFCFLFLLFAYFGRSMPGPIQHFGLSVPRIIEELYLTTDGLFGLVTGVSATYIYLFVLFGAFLTSTKTSDFFNDISMALTGHLKGGPAKISVLSSALMGTISGSTSANVATTGAFTIPLMKSIGYEPHFAGAVEAAASTGGQIMPPVMGAAAFIIADTLNIPYTQVLLCAIVPALLYFWGIWCSLSLEASRLGLKGLPKETLPRAGEVLVTSGYKAIPLFVIVYFLVKGYNPLYSGCWGIGCCVLLSFVKKSDRMDLTTFVNTLKDGSLGALSVAMACIIVGNVIGMMGATGVALRIGDAVLALTRGHLVLTMCVTLLIATLLGMGMPTTASYVMASAVAAPALTLLGVKGLDAHMFVFFYAVLSSVTPPVCVGAYTAAGLANADPNRTALTGVKLALPGFIVPFIFVLAPEILLTNVTNWFVTFQAMVSAVVGVFLLSCFTENFFMAPLRWYERLLALAGSLALLYPGTLSDAVGLAILVLLWLASKKRAARAVSE
ncbi:MAG: TRAP transporter permease [Pyramidobacter sp.]|nr:TRAP transporter permease [Pyramidobacter sp.]